MRERKVGKEKEENRIFIVGEGGGGGEKVSGSNFYDGFVTC